MGSLCAKPERPDPRTNSAARPPRAPAPAPAPTPPAAPPPPGHTPGGDQPPGTSHDLVALMGAGVAAVEATQAGSAADAARAAQAERLEKQRAARQRAALAPGPPGTPASTGLGSSLSAVSLSSGGGPAAAAAEEAPPHGVPAEEILRAFYAAIEPGEDHERRIAQLVKECAKGGKKAFAKKCMKLRTQHGRSPVAVWKAASGGAGTPPATESRSSDIDAGQEDGGGAWPELQTRSRSESPPDSSRRGRSLPLTRRRSVPCVTTSSIAKHMERVQSQRRQQELARDEGERRWRQLQKQQRAKMQRQLQRAKRQLRWQKLVQQYRLDAIKQRANPERRKDSQDATRPKLARSDGSANTQSTAGSSESDEESNAEQQPDNLGGFKPSYEIEDFDDIEKVGYIAKGASGSVYKAKWQGMWCAVKVFDCNSSDPDVKRAFQHEVNFLRHLSHENLVRLYGFCTDPMAILTEFLNGNLSDLLYGKNSRPAKGGPMIKMTDKRQNLISLGVANGLRFLHNQGICHRDLKSPNVLYDRDLRIKLCDFAFSTFKEKVENETVKFESRVGTPAWMAPEILRGEEYTLSADIYSFGVIMWEMVFRSEPFKGVNAYAIAHQVGNTGRRLEIEEGCPAVWRQLMLRCWSDAPSRPTSSDIVEILAKLRGDIAAGKTIADGAGSFLDDEPVTAEPGAQPQPEPQLQQ